MKGSVKIMLSYDYSHFEIVLSTDEDLDVAGVNALRKTAQRLADEAVRQYKRAKEEAALRQDAALNRAEFLRDIDRIKSKDPQDRTIAQAARLKSYEDGEWEAQFQHDYDYDDDEDQKF